MDLVPDNYGGIKIKDIEAISSFHAGYAFVEPVFARAAGRAITSASIALLDDEAWQLQLLPKFFTDKSVFYNAIFQEAGLISRLLLSIGLFSGNQQFPFQSKIFSSLGLSQTPEDCHHGYSATPSWAHLIKVPVAFESETGVIPTTHPGIFDPVLDQQFDGHKYMLPAQILAEAGAEPVPESGDCVVIERHTGLLIERRTLASNGSIYYRPLLTTPQAKAAQVLRRLTASSNAQNPAGNNQQGPQS